MCKIENLFLEICGFSIINENLGKNQNLINIVSIVSNTCFMIHQTHENINLLSFQRVGLTPKGLP